LHDHWSPQVHALLTRGGWNCGGEWALVPFVDGEGAALLLRHGVSHFLQTEGLLSEEPAGLLL